MEPLQNIKLTFKCPKQLNDLQPCNGDWYCDSCRKVVHDFRGMTEAQIMDAFKKSNSQMCGLFEADRIQVLPQQKWFRWLSAAMLALGMTTLHQRLYAQVTPVIDTSKTNKTTAFKMGELQVLPGKKFSKEAIIRSKKDTVKDIVFGIVDGISPEYPGGETALAKYLYDHVKYSGNHEGKAFVQFVVEKDGSLTNIKMIRSAGKDIDEQIIKALKNSKKWKPGMQDGKPISVQYTVPFNLECKE